MNNILRLTAVAFAGAMAIGAAQVTPAAASERAGVTQDLSAACRIVKETHWNHGRKVIISRKSCSPGYGYGYGNGYGYHRYAYHHYGYAQASCRYVVKTRISEGRKVSVRTRVCT